LVLTSVAGPSP